MLVKMCVKMLVCAAFLLAAPSTIQGFNVGKWKYSVARSSQKLKSEAGSGNVTSLDRIHTRPPKPHA